MAYKLRIGTRDSQLAVWQAKLVQEHLQVIGIESELIYIKSQGDIDTVTPLYALGVQGVFTKSLDAALLNNRIDIAVHSMKDVPTQLAVGIDIASVLKRASYKDLLIYKNEPENISLSTGQWETFSNKSFTIATSSIRRKAQWLHRFPNHKIENLRGNVNTRLNKLELSNWNAAIFAAAGLERINLRPKNSIEIDWMLPAPAQGAILVVCREKDNYIKNICKTFNDEETALCTMIERDFLNKLHGGCSTPISALAYINNQIVIFKGCITMPDGSISHVIEKNCKITEANDLGSKAALELLKNGGNSIIEHIKLKGIA